MHYTWFQSMMSIVIYRLAKFSIYGACFACHNNNIMRLVYQTCMQMFIAIESRHIEVMQIMRFKLMHHSSYISGCYNL